MEELREELDKIWTVVHSHSQYVAGHESKIDAYWKAQWEWNMRIEQLIDSHAAKITDLEKRVILMAGAGSVGGTLLGYLLEKIIGG